MTTPELMGLIDAAYKEGEEIFRLAQLKRLEDTEAKRAEQRKEWALFIEVAKAFVPQWAYRFITTHGSPNFTNNMLNYVSIFLPDCEPFYLGFTCTEEGPIFAGYFHLDDDSERLIKCSAFSEALFYARNTQTKIIKQDANRTEEEMRQLLAPGTDLIVNAKMRFNEGSYAATSVIAQIAIAEHLSKLVVEVRRMNDFFGIGEAS